MRITATRLAAVLILSAALAQGGITFTCDPNIDGTVPGLCNTLNTTTAALYNNTFSNANAAIYIQFGSTGLGSNTGYENFVPYSVYVAAAGMNAGASAIQTAAANALRTYAAPIYGKGMVNLSAALGASLGIAGMYGTTSTGNYCNYPGPSCYAGIVIVSDKARFYYRTGTPAANGFDFFTTVEHEVDEVLGTSSCIDTTGPTLSNGCMAGVPAAVDLFRYSGLGKLVNVSSLSTAQGAYFSYDGGTSDVAPGLFYNSLSNGDDYADFASACPAAVYYVQDAAACGGQGYGLDITNDGNVESIFLRRWGIRRRRSAGCLRSETRGW